MQNQWEVGGSGTTLLQTLEIGKRVLSEPSKDPQSNASLKDPNQPKAGDEHPARQPDEQEQPSRSTGIGGQTAVKGGKEGGVGGEER